MADFTNIDETSPKGTQSGYVLDDTIRETRAWAKNTFSLISGFPDNNILYLATWTTETRPAVTKIGLFGYNSTTKKLERFNGTSFEEVLIESSDGAHAATATADDNNNPIITTYAVKESPTINNPTFTGTAKGNFIEGIQNIGNITASALIDCAAGNIITATLTGDCTVGFTANSTGYARGITLILTNGGNFTLSWATNIKWTDGIKPVLTANGKDILSFLTIDNGVTWYGSVNGSALA